MINAFNINILAVSLAGGIWDIIISVLLFALVVLIVVTVFSHRGQVELSPQRAAAIATGHTDRKTIFENPAFRPVMWIFLSIGFSLHLPSAKKHLKKKLIATGSPNYYTPEEYLALSMLAGFALGILLTAGRFIVVGDFSLFGMLVGFIIGFALSIYQISDKASSRLHKIMKRLPYAIDLIALAMGSGATFTEAVKTITRTTDDNEDDPLKVELRTLLAEIDLGTTRREALMNMTERVPLESIRGLGASVSQAEELGTPLEKVLHDQATLMRMQRSVRAENKAAIASVRILVPCLLLVVAVMLAIFGPAIIRTLQEGLF